MISQPKPISLLGKFSSPKRDHSSLIVSPSVHLMFSLNLFSSTELISPLVYLSWTLFEGLRLSSGTECRSFFYPWSEDTGIP